MSEDIEKIEYKIRKVERYIVTRYEAAERKAGSQVFGEFDRADTAYEVAYALCRAEHDRLEWALDDERIRYPEPIEKAAPLP